MYIMNKKSQNAEKALKTNDFSGIVTRLGVVLSGRNNAESIICDFALHVTQYMVLRLDLMKRTIAPARKNTFFTVYFLILSALLVAGTLLGCVFVSPILRTGTAALSSFCSTIVHGGSSAFFSCLLSVLLFPLLIFLASMLRHGVYAVGLLVLLRGFVFGYIFSLFACLGDGALLAALVLREAALLALLFSVCAAAADKILPEACALIQKRNPAPVALLMLGTVLVLYFALPLLLEKI